MTKRSIPGAIFFGISSVLVLIIICITHSKKDKNITMSCYCGELYGHYLHLDTWHWPEKDKYILSFFKDPNYSDLELLATIVFTDEPKKAKWDISGYSEDKNHYDLVTTFLMNDPDYCIISDDPKERLFIVVEFAFMEIHEDKYLVHSFVWD